MNSPLFPLFISHRSCGEKLVIFKQIYHPANFLFSSQIMLVFSKEDAQTDSFVHAAERGGYVCQICKTSEEAMEQYINVQPDVRMPFILIVNIERIFWKVVAQSRNLVSSELVFVKFQNVSHHLFWIREKAVWFSFTMLYERKFLQTYKFLFF